MDMEMVVVTGKGDHHCLSPNMNTTSQATPIASNQHPPVICQVASGARNTRRRPQRIIVIPAKLMNSLV
jgi:hypothetical protein